MELPETGRDEADVLEGMEAMREDDADWKSGRTWSLVYHVDDEHAAFRDEAHARFSTQNALSPSAFPRLAASQHGAVP